MEEQLFYLGGDWATSTEKLEVLNPFTGKKISTVYQATPSQLETAVEKAQQSRKELNTLSAHQRSKILLFIAETLASQAFEFSLLVSQESAKPFKYAQSEVERAIQVFLIAAEETKRWPGEIISLDWTEAGNNKQGIVNYFPAGIVAGISPFNFPLNLAVHKIAGAIAAACPILLKPASKTPLSTLKLAKIIHNSALPKGAFSVLPCNRNTGNTLVRHPGISVLSFTGSPEIGWKIKEQSGKKKTILELGGNAGVIVSPSANLRQAIDRCIFGAFSYSGQVCIHAQRIYVHESVWESFISAFVAQCSALVYGDPTLSSTEISCMIDEENAIRVENWIQEALQSGAQLLTGGKRTGNFVEPTVLTQVNTQCQIYAEEVFGPVVIIEKYHDFTTALQALNNSKFGLQAGVFTNSLTEMNLAFMELEVGGVIINEVPTFRVDHMPYGGIKNSGLGREGVKYTMVDYLEPKLLVKPIL